MTLSPRLDDARVAAIAGSYDQPEPHTLAEIAQMIRLASSRGAETVTIGHSDDPHSAAAAKAFATAWIERGGHVLGTVQWPSDAASWLREARNLIRFHPDLYVLGGAPAGLAQMIRRLVWSTNWTARSTIGFASAAAPAMHLLAGVQYLDGLTGATRDGDTWRITDAEITLNPPQERA
ncbi:MAG TPA: ABC transporter substrate-binding protein [Microbacteriaceae bacterium]